MRLMLPLAPLVLALPGHAQAQTCTGTTSTSTCFTDPAGLADTSEPGSVLVYQKFQTGTVTVDAGTAAATTQPRSLIELGAVCPTDVGGNCGSEDELVVRVEFHWVTPPQPDNAGNHFSSPGICQENNFFANLTFNGKVWFTPNGDVVHGDPNPLGSVEVVPAAPGIRGYLIGWVVNLGLNNGGSVTWTQPHDRPIRLDALIGDAVMRTTSASLTGYKALGIQGDPRTNEGQPLTAATQNNLGQTSLPFTGLPGAYQEVTGQLSGDVVYASDVTPPFADTQLILLTLDVLSSQTNQPTFVNVNFYTPGQVPVSETLSFTCWGQINLTTIDPSLTREALGQRGVFTTSQAFNSGSPAGEVTMLGLVQVTEGAIPGPGNSTRSYTIPVFNNSIPIPTTFTAQ
jgi:hypothetical protein